MSIILNLISELAICAGGRHGIYTTQRFYLSYQQHLQYLLYFSMLLPLFIRRCALHFAFVFFFSNSTRKYQIYIPVN